MYFYVKMESLILMLVVDWYKFFSIFSYYNVAPVTPIKNWIICKFIKF